MKEKVSVVIPLFNKASYIQRALYSVLSQTFQGFEIIVIDDGSTDEGHQNVLSFDDRRIRLIRQENTGVSAARNRGVDEAHTNFIAFLDADDEWLPTHLQTIMRLRETYPDAGAYATAYLICAEKGKVIHPNYQAIPPEPWEGPLPRYFLSAALGHYPVNSSVLCMPKKIFHEMGRYPADTWYGEDADLWARIALSYQIVFSWHTGAIYHWDAACRACTKELPFEEAPFIRSIESFLEKNQIRPDIKNDLYEYIAKFELDRAFRLLEAGRSEEAIKIFFTCKTKYRRWEKSYGILVSLLPRWVRVPVRHLITFIRSIIISLNFRFHLAVLPGVK